MVILMRIVSMKIFVSHVLLLKCQNPWRVAHQAVGLSELAFKRAVGLEILVPASTAQKCQCP